MIADLEVHWDEWTVIFCDSQGVPMLAKKPIFYEQTKHIDVHCHFTQRLVENEYV